MNQARRIEFSSWKANTAINFVQINFNTSIHEVVDSQNKYIDIYQSFRRNFHVVLPDDTLDVANISVLPCD